MRAAVALAVPDGASSFVSACSSTISARPKTVEASSAKRIISTAPSAKLGAKKHGTPGRRAHDRRPPPRRSPSSRSRRARPPRGTARTFAQTASGRVKSTRDVAPRRPVDAPVDDRRGRPARAPGRAPTRPCRPSRTGRPSCRSASAGLKRATAARKRLSRGPMPAADSARGRTARWPARRCRLPSPP